jgi:hypothetical protein
LPLGCTLLVEIIHPDTEVIRSYDGDKKFVLIGCRRNPLRSHMTGIDLTHKELQRLGQTLGLEVAKVISGNDVEELRTEVKRRDITNREGWVATLVDGRRVKFKYETYIGEMVKGKLSYKYLMQCAVGGRLEKMILTLDEESYHEALKMLGQVGQIVCVPAKPKTNGAGCMNFTDRAVQESLPQSSRRAWLIFRRSLKFFQPCLSRKAGFLCQKIS